MKKVQILSVSKNEIIIVAKKTKKRSLILPILTICLFVGLFLSNNYISLSLKDSVVKVFDPVNSLYSDNSEAIFTSGDIIDKDETSVTIPIKGAGYEILSDGDIEFTVGNSIIVMACSSGKVDKIGVTLDGYKYIQIIHRNGLKSIVTNIEIVGVNEGDIIKSGQDIATARVGDKVRLSLFLNDIQITNLKISKSKIIWEN